MKNSITLSLMCILSIGIVAAQSEKSGAHEAGYFLGYYSAMLWPYLLAVAAVYIIYRVIRRKRQVRA